MSDKIILIGVIVSTMIPLQIWGQETDDVSVTTPTVLEEEQFSTLEDSPISSTPITDSAPISVDEDPAALGELLAIEGYDVLLTLNEIANPIRGKEYEIVRGTTTNTELAIGLLKIKAIHEEFVEGQMLVGANEIELSDTLRKSLQFGIEITPYFRAMVDYSTFSEWTFVSGIEVNFDIGFFRVRPYIGVEFPFTPLTVGRFFSSMVYAGGEVNWYWGRVRFRPSFAIGLGLTTPISNSAADAIGSVVSHFGGMGLLNVEFIIFSHIYVGLSVGYAHWAGILAVQPANTGNFFANNGGLIFGAHVTIK